MENREATVSRNTKETQIQLKFAVDGSGVSDICTGIDFFDHNTVLSIPSFRYMVSSSISAPPSCSVLHHFLLAKPDWFRL